MTNIATVKPWPMKIDGLPIDSMVDLSMANCWSSPDGTIFQRGYCKPYGKGDGKIAPLEKVNKSL